MLNNFGFAMAQSHSSDCKPIPFLANSMFEMREFMIQLWNSKKMCDITIICQSEKFQCHKLIICARSDVFQTMFDEDSNSKEAKNGVLEIVDFDPKTVEAFLKYIYTDEVDSSEDLDINLIYIAHKYNVSRLVSVCASILRRQINDENIVELLVAGYFLENHGLLEAAKNYIFNVNWEPKDDDEKYWAKYVGAKSEQAANASNQNSNSNQASGSGKFVCEICQKAFHHHQQLFLHKKVHIFERPYRCDPCGISFRTFGTLQKHKRSTSHFNKVNINATFGEPSSSNPRPFLCSDCNTGFRIHGHLAKHLRSKSHIMKLENLGKLPIGLFAEMERIGTNFNEIDTQDCDSSLDSLKKMAAKLWKNKEISVDASNTNGLLSPHHTPEISIKEEPMDTTSTSSGRRSLEPEIQNYRKSPEFQQSATIIQRSSIPSTMNPPNGNTALNLSMPTNLVLHENKNHHDIRRASFSSSGHEDGGPPSTDNSDMENGLKHDSRYHKKFFTSVEHHHEPSPQVVAQTQPPPQPSPVTQPPPPAPPQQQQRILVPQVPQPTPLYGRPLHLSRGYPVVYSNGLISNMSREGSLSSDSGDGSGPISPVVNMKCEICGLSFGNSKSLQQVNEIEFF